MCDDEASAKAAAETIRAVEHCTRSLQPCVNVVNAEFGSGRDAREILSR